MNHKGYLGVLKVDEEAGVLRGKVVNTRDTITFQGKTVEDAAQAFRDSVDDYLEFCESLGQKPDKPYSGKFVVRVAPALHQAISAIAADKGTSVNRLVEAQLAKLARRMRSRRALMEQVNHSKPGDYAGGPANLMDRHSSKPRKAAAIKLKTSPDR